jgi:oligo-1,6-glucosidase
MSDQGNQAGWWRDALFYQIYPRSFQDTDGDGFGDLAGISARLDYLRDLGVTALWLSPVYPSPDKDNGYDIADYCAIDPRYGTLDDFDRLVAAAGERGIRIVMDLVVNHTSDQHPWFQASRRREAGYEDFYIWRPEPNNWTGFFMEPAWTFDEVRGEYYLHLFDQGQPDLNWRHPDVVAAVKEVLTFWLDRGVAGFRCDVINLLWKTSFEDSRSGPIRGLEHYRSQPGLHPLLRELRADVLGPRGAFTVGETVMVTLPEAKDLTDPERGELDLVFYFDHLEVDRLVARYGSRPFDAGRLLQRLTAWQQGLDWNAVYLENHDQPRIVSHYGDDSERWRERSAKLLAVLLLTLRGTPFLYQGQELGVPNADLAWDELDDVEARNIDALLARRHVPAAVRRRLILPAARDNARTPMPWDATPGGGFTTGIPWLRLNRHAATINAAAQLGDPDSVLEFYRRLIALRRRTPVLRDGGFEPLAGTRHVLGFRRTGDRAVDVWLNFSARAHRIPQFTPGRVLVSTAGRREADNTLKPWEGLVIEHERVD